MVGIVNTLTDFIILNLLRVITHTQSSSTSKLVALNIISASSVAVISFFLNRKYVFKSEDTRNHMIIPFLLITLGGIFIVQSTVISLALHNFDPLAKLVMDIFGLVPAFRNISFNFYETNIAKLFATAASMIWNYIWYNKIVFKQR